MRRSVQKFVKGGRCSAVNQYYKSNFSDEVFKFISKEIDIFGNICEISNKYFELTSKHRKINEDKYDSQYKDYRDSNQDKKAK